MNITVLGISSSYDEARNRITTKARFKIPLTPELATGDNPPQPAGGRDKRPAWDSLPVVDVIADTFSTKTIAESAYYREAPPQYRDFLPGFLTVTLSIEGYSNAASIIRRVGGTVNADVRIAWS